VVVALALVGRLFEGCGATICYIPVSTSGSDGTTDIQAAIT